MVVGKYLFGSRWGWRERGNWKTKACKAFHHDWHCLYVQIDFFRHGNIQVYKYRWPLRLWNHEKRRLAPFIFASINTRIKATTIFWCSMWMNSIKQTTSDRLVHLETFWHFRHWDHSDIFKDHVHDLVWWSHFCVVARIRPGVQGRRTKYYASKSIRYKRSELLTILAPNNSKPQHKSERCEIRQLEVMGASGYPRADGLGLSHRRNAV